MNSVVAKPGSQVPNKNMLSPTIVLQNLNNLYNGLIAREIAVKLIIWNHSTNRITTTLTGLLTKVIHSRVLAWNQEITINQGMVLIGYKENMIGDMPTILVPLIV